MNYIVNIDINILSINSSYQIFHAKNTFSNLHTCLAFFLNFHYLSNKTSRVSDSSFCVFIHNKVIMKIRS